MFLTYSAIIMLYVPAAVERQFDQMKHDKAVAAEKAKEGASAPTPSPEGKGAVEEPKTLPTNPILWVVVLILVFAISCVERSSDSFSPSFFSIAVSSAPPSDFISPQKSSAASRARCGNRAPAPSPVSAPR